MAMTRVGLLKLTDKKAWEKEVRAAMGDGASIATAAAALGVSTRQLARWLAECPKIPRREGGRPAAEE